RPPKHLAGRPRVTACSNRRHSHPNTTLRHCRAYRTIRTYWIETGPRAPRKHNHHGPQLSWPNSDVDTGGEFIFLSARELREDRRQTEKDTTPAPDCPRRPEPHVTAPPATVCNPRSDPPRRPCRLPQGDSLPPDR